MVCAVVVIQGAVAAASTAEPLVFWTACPCSTGADPPPPVGIYSQPLNKPGANATVVYMPASYEYDVTNLVVGDEYLYFGGMWSIQRCRFDGSERGLYVSTNQTQYGYGDIYAMAFYDGTLYYQTQANYGVYAIDVNSEGPSVVSIGRFGYSGNGGMNGGLTAMRGATGPTMLFWGVDESENGPDGQILSAPAVAGANATIINRGAAEFPRGVTALPGLSGVVFGAAVYGDAVYRISVTGGSVTKIPGPPNRSGLNAASMAVIPGTTKLMVAQSGQPATPYGLFTLDLSTDTWEPFNTQPHFGPYSVGIGGARVAVPTVTEVSPSSGPQDANTTVFVIGTGFKQSPSLACLFGRSVLATASFQTSEVVKCVAPPSPVAGKAEVQVTNDGLRYSTQHVYFTYTPAAALRR